MCGPPKRKKSDIAAGFGPGKCKLQNSGDDDCQGSKLKGCSWQAMTRIWLWVVHETNVQVWITNLVSINTGEERQFHLINIYLMKDSNQSIGALSEVIQGTFLFTCIPLQITCQSCAWWIITERVTWISRSLIPGKGQLWNASKKSGRRTVRKTPYSKALRINPAGCYTFRSSVENINPTEGYRQWQAKAAKQHLVETSDWSRN